MLYKLLDSNHALNPCEIAYNFYSCSERERKNYSQGAEKALRAAAI